MFVDVSNCFKLFETVTLEGGYCTSPEIGTIKSKAFKLEIIKLLL